MDKKNQDFSNFPLGKRLIAFLVIGLFVLVGCEEDVASPSGKETPFIGGTDGLLIDLLDDSPPEEVTDGGNYPFDVVVKLENAGEEMIVKEDVVVEISGIDPGEFGLTEEDLVKNPDEDLEATRKSPEGSKVKGTLTYVTFPGFNYAGSLSGNTPFIFRADVCYKYRTITNSKLCILEDLIEVDDDALCKANERKTTHNSGAPVQVTSFEENVRGTNKIAFTFEIEHRGNGRIYKADTGCDVDLRTDEDKVWINVSSGLENLKCTGLGDLDTEGYVNLYDGKRTVTCTQEIDSPSNREKTVKINLVYDYEDDTTTQIIVKHLID